MRIIPAPTRRLVSSLAVACLFLAHGAYAADLYGPKDSHAHQGGSLTIGSLVQPPGLDPFHQAAEARIAISVLMYQGLMYEDASGTPTPLLAESMTVAPDGLTYTFHLRRNVRFHNGNPMTAADVKYSYDYIRDPRNGSPGAGDFRDIESIDAPDDFTVVFHLSRPNASLPMTLGNKYGAVVPKDTFAAPGASARLNQQDVGTGPFRLAGFEANSFLKLERFKNYWEPGTPYLDQVTFLFLPNSASLLVALQGGRVGLALLSRPNDIAQVKSKPGITITTWPSLVQKSLDLDCAQPPLDDVRVRQAIALAIDKQAVLQVAYQGYGQVLGTIVGGMQANWGLPLAANPWQTPNPQKARALLREAGHADGVSLDLTTIIGYDWMDSAAVAIADELHAVGINVAIKKVDLGVWINNFRSHHMGFTFNDWGTSPDPNLLFYRHFHKRPEGADFRNWNNEAASRLLDAGKAASDPVERRKLYQQFQAILAETVPTIMLFGPDLIVASGKGVENYIQHPTGWYFGVVRAYVRN
jgi:peptide/nickel transport system substrate-binding protein